MKAKRICGIYCIENILNNKKYIGFSSNINRRWIEHNYSLKNKKDTRHLQNAWDIYGKENFIYYLLETCLPEHLEEKEIYWISMYNTQDRKFGYNLDSGGRKNRKNSDETLKIKSENKKGKPNFTQEYKDKMSKERTNKKQRGSSSRYIGIHYNNKRQKWVSTITVNKKLIWLGYCKSEKDAVEKYNNYIITNKLSNPPNYFLN